MWWEIIFNGKKKKCRSLPEPLRCNSRIKRCSLFVSSHPISTDGWNKWDWWTAAVRSRGHEGRGDTTHNGELTEVNTRQMSLLAPHNGSTRVGQSGWDCSRRQSNIKRCLPPTHTHTRNWQIAEIQQEPWQLPGLFRGYLVGGILENGIAACVSMK